MATVINSGSNLFFSIWFSSLSHYLMGRVFNIYNIFQIDTFQSIISTLWHFLMFWHSFTSLLWNTLIFCIWVLYHLPKYRAFLLESLLFTFHSYSTVRFSHSVMSDSLRPHELQHARPPCPLPTPGVHLNPCPLSWWCHPTISSSVIPFSSCSQSFPASGSFQMS